MLSGTMNESHCVPSSKLRESSNKGTLPRVPSSKSVVTVVRVVRMKLLHLHPMGHTKSCGGRAFVCPILHLYALTSCSVSLSRRQSPEDLAGFSVDAEHHRLR